MQKSPFTIEDLRSGNSVAWSSLYDWLAPDLRSFITRAGSADPDDILGETMLQLVRDLPRFTDDADALRPWAFRIARNRVIDAARRKDRRPVEVTMSDEDSLPVEVRSDGTVDMDRLRRALDTLNPEQRQILWLRYAVDMSVAETARAMSTTEDAVTASTMRALRRLRQGRDID